VRNVGPKMRKAPANRGLLVEVSAVLNRTPQLLLFLRSSFFLGGCFLGCVLHKI
jgi:hypothetical protein